MLVEEAELGKRVFIRLISPNRIYKVFIHNKILINKLKNKKYKI